jgi:uncharacterized radical SAM superfamily protein
VNPCELEIDLFCRGMRIPSGVSLAGARGVTRTRAGLGSGLEIVVPTQSRIKRNIWLNVPVQEDFARGSPYRLHGSLTGGYSIVDDRSRQSYAVSLPQEPAWYTVRTSSGVPMNRIGVLQGTCLGIYINPVCAFWNYAPALNCRFCTTGQNVGTAEALEKSVSDVVETCLAARRESAITFVHLNGGFQGSRGLAFALPYVRAIKERVGLLVGVQLAPERDFARYDDLIASGVDHVSFCLEFLDPEWFARICPGKAQVHGQKLFLDALAYCAARMRSGSVSGEIIAGLEPIDRTLEAIDLIAGLGAFPTVCIFRPTCGSDMEDWPPPSYQEMREVMVHVYEACRRRWIPVGVAPNIEVSLVVTPDETAFLAPRTAGFYVYEAYRRLARVAARPIFAHRLRPRRVPSTRAAG